MAQGQLKPLFISKKDSAARRKARKVARATRKRNRRKK